jgi:hypothetical protein
MKELLQKAKINDSQLKNFIVKTVAKNLTSLSEPCFFPELKKNLYEFLRVCGLEEKDIREFARRRWKGRKEAKFNVVIDPAANFYIFLLQYFLEKKDIVVYRHMMVMYMIRQYANLMYKHFKYCNPDVFQYALETLTKTHLFARERTISNAIYFMAQEMIRKWTTDIKKNDLEKIGKFMQESRHRISQSVKSFAQTYYSASEKGLGIRSDETPTDSSDDDENSYQEKSVEKGNRIIEDVVSKITVYRYKDIKAQEEARLNSKINSSIATQIVNSLNNPKYSDNLRTILKKYIEELTNMNQLCGKSYKDYIRKLMSLKRTKQKIYFKQQVNILLISLLKDFKYLDKYNKQTSQTQFLMNLFLAYYLTMILRNTLCIGRN